jgi:hypothetical protein
LSRPLYLCLEKTGLTDLFKNQIVSLNIHISKNEQSVVEDVNTPIFTNIFTMFTNIQCLNFSSSSIWCQKLSFNISPPSFISSTLLELYVNVTNFTDCLYLLDGRFNQLRTFHVNITLIRSSRLIINNTVNYLINI